MGEAWSDWYAKDFLVRRRPRERRPRHDGEIDMGEYTDGVPTSTRFAARRSTARSAPATRRLPRRRSSTGDPAATRYGDFGHVVRSGASRGARRRRDLGPDAVGPAHAPVEVPRRVGSDVAELVTDGMRLSPPEPSFLDMRNAILAADRRTRHRRRQPRPDLDRVRGRGMGFFASAADGSDTAPAEDFAAAAGPDGPKGTIAGTVTDADTGLPIAGVAGRASPATPRDPAFAGLPAPRRRTRTAATRSPTVPRGHLPEARVPAGGRLRPGQLNRNVVVPAGGDRASATPRCAATGRRVAAAPTVSAQRRHGRRLRLRPLGLIDQTLGRRLVAVQPGQSRPPRARTPAPDPFAVIELPETIDRRRTSPMDPGNTCGDDGTADDEGLHASRPRPTA